ncbi:hypothetical protein [Pinirhizobacter sp.]|jgi:hypothetical protein|uniref:hypothetical protein n=1 Tax=Pinirhizobacter sp. TaxID=2950432 RepID=UPI002F401737
MKAKQTLLIAGLLAITALPTAAQINPTVKGVVESIRIGDDDGGASIVVKLDGQPDREWKLHGGRNLNDAPGMGILQLLTLSHTTGTNVTLRCIDDCGTFMFDTVTLN